MSGRIYKKEKEELLCSEDGGKSWFELVEHLKKEHGIDMQKLELGEGE